MLAIVKVSRLGRLKGLFIWGLISTFAPATQAQEFQDPLTLEDCRQYALAHQPAVAAANLSAMAGSQKAGALNRLPLIARFSREVPIRKQQANWGITASSAQAEQASLDTLFDVNFTYLSVLYGQKQLEVANNGLKNLTDLRDIAQSILKEGTRADVTTRHTDQIEIMLLTGSARKETAVGGIQRAQAALREAMGLQSGDPLALAAKDLPVAVTMPDKDEVLNGARNQRGEVRAARALAEVSRWEVKAQGSTGFFRLQSRTFASGADLHSFSVPSGTRGEDYLPAGVGPEMPANLAGRRRDRQATAAIYANRAAVVAEKAENLAVLEAENFLIRFKENSVRAEKLNQAALLAEKLSTKLKERFDPRSTKVSLDEVLNAGTMAVSTRLDANEATYRALLDLATLERASGGAFRLELNWPQSNP